MIGRLVLGAWLVVLWLMLWGHLSFANLVSGAVVAAGVLLVVPVRGERHPTAREEPRTFTVRPWHAGRFVLWTIGQVLVSSLRLAWEVVTPTNSIAMGVVRVPLRGVSDAHTAIVANVITLTPGTISLDVTADPTVLEVHVLHLRDPDEVVRSTQALERRVVQSFGTRAARQAFDRAEAAR